MEYDGQDEEDKEGQENEKIYGIPKMMPPRSQKITTIKKRIRQTGFAEACKKYSRETQTKLMTHWWARQHRR